MYGKIFASMFDGTLALGPWQAIVTLQQLIILADEEGEVDMTVEALSRRTTIPVEILRIGIEHLSAPDPHSRSPELEGRRIILIDDSRPWGWRIVNYAKYREIRSKEDRREYMRKHMREKRSKPARVSSSLASVSNSKRALATLADAEVEAEAEEEAGGERAGAQPPAEPPAEKPQERLHASPGHIQTWEILLGEECERRKLTPPGATRDQTRQIAERLRLMCRTHGVAYGDACRKLASACLDAVRGGKGKFAFLALEIDPYADQGTANDTEPHLIAGTPENLAWRKAQGWV